MTSTELPRSVTWPEHWRNMPLWAMFDRIKDVGHPDEEMLSVYREHGVIKKSSRDDNTNQTAENRDIYQLVDDGWLIVNRMKAWQGSVGISSFRGIVSGHYLCFRPRHREEPRYLNWLLRSRVYATEYFRMSRGVRPGQIEIDNERLRGLRVALPPLDEQRHIADFLDAEVGRLSAVEIARRRQIDLLRRRRLSAARDILANGDGVRLDLKPPVTWLPSCPTHWTWQRLSRVTQCLDGRRVPLSAVERAERRGPYSYYGSSSVVDHIDDYLFDEQLVLFGEDGAQLANPNIEIAFAVSGKIWVNNHAHVLRPVGVDAKFLAILLNVVDRQLCISGSTREKITQDDMSALVVPVPPYDEQIELVSRAEAVFAEQGDLTEALEKQVGLLGERRQALITAAVTGQIDVTTARGIAV